MFGMNFDKKLKWNQHLQKLKKCNSLCGKNWALQPKMSLWLYTKVKIYAALWIGVWWPETRQTRAIRPLNASERQAL